MANYKTVSTGHPAGECNDRNVFVVDGSGNIVWGVDDVKKEDSWIWDGAGSQEFQYLDKAIEFAQYRMGNE